MSCVECHIVDAVDVYHFAHTLKNGETGRTFNYLDTTRCFGCCETYTPEKTEEDLGKSTGLNMIVDEALLEYDREEPREDDNDTLIRCTDCHIHKEPKSFRRIVKRKDTEGVKRDGIYYASVCGTCYNIRSQKKHGYIVDDPTMAKRCVKCKLTREATDFPLKRVYKKKYTSSSNKKIGERSALCRFCQVRVSPI